MILTGECHTSAWYVFSQYLHTRLFLQQPFCVLSAGMYIFVTKTTRVFLRKVIGLGILRILWDTDSGNLKLGDSQKKTHPVKCWSCGRHQKLSLTSWWLNGQQVATDMRNNGSWIYIASACERLHSTEEVGAWICIVAQTHFSIKVSTPWPHKILSSQLMDKASSALVMFAFHWISDLSRNLKCNYFFAQHSFQNVLCNSLICMYLYGFTGKTLCNRRLCKGRDTLRTLKSLQVSSGCRSRIRDP